MGQKLGPASNRNASVLRAAQGGAVDFAARYAAKPPALSVNVAALRAAVRKAGQ